MAAPVLASIGTRLAGASRSNSAVPAPAGVAAGDVILLHFYAESSTTPTAPTGFTALSPIPQTATNVTVQRTYWKRATGADTGTYDFTHAAFYTVAVAERYTGCVATGTPVEAYTQAANSTALTSSPAVSTTTLGPDRLLVLGTTNFNAGTWTAPNGWTKQLDGEELASFTKSQPAAGSSGTAQALVTTSGRMTATLLALIPGAAVAVDATVTGATATGSGFTDPGVAAGAPAPDATVAGATATGSGTANAGSAAGSTSPDAVVAGATATGSGNAPAGVAAGAAAVTDVTVPGATATGSAASAAGLPTGGGAAIEPPRVGAEWVLQTRGPDGRLTGPVPVLSLSAVTRHLGVGTGTATVPYSRHAYNLLTEGAGVLVYRNGHRVSSGFLTSVEESWPEDTIRVQWMSEEVLFQDHVVVPDPTRPGDQQTTEGYYERNGVASTLMVNLINEQMGPAAHEQWRVPGLTVGPDPVVGGGPTLMPYYGRYQDVMTALKALVSYSDVELGVRLGPDLVAQVVTPVESVGTARFSTELGNLTSYTFTRAAPTVTDVIVAEAGLPIPEPTGGWTPGSEPSQMDQQIYGWMTAVQETFPSTDPIATAWQRRIWEFTDQSGKIDWKYFSDVRADMRRQAAQEAQNSGAAKVELTCTLRDTPRLKYGTDWDVGHRVTVYVGRPGEPKVEVVDVVREVAFEYGKDGEKITPAIGSADATALPFLPSRQVLNRIRSRLAGLERKS